MHQRVARCRKECNSSNTGAEKLQEKDRELNESYNTIFSYFYKI